jgi:hypothetical protein
LSFTPLLRVKRCYACDQWHSSRVDTFLPVHIVNCGRTLKVTFINMTTACAQARLHVRCSFLNRILHSRMPLGDPIHAGAAIHFFQTLKAIRRLRWVWPVGQEDASNHELCRPPLNKLKANSDDCDGCAGHPGVEGHRGMYEAAWPVVGKVMGWN